MTTVNSKTFDWHALRAMCDALPADVAGFAAALISGDTEMDSTVRAFAVLCLRRGHRNALSELECSLVRWHRWQGSSAYPDLAAAAEAARATLVACESIGAAAAAAQFYADVCAAIVRALEREAAELGVRVG